MFACFRHIITAIHPLRGYEIPIDADVSMNYQIIASKFSIIHPLATPSPYLTEIMTTTVKKTNIKVDRNMNPVDNHLPHIPPQIRANLDSTCPHLQYRYLH